MNIPEEHLTKCAPCTGCWDVKYQGNGIYCRYGGEPATCVGPKEDTMPELYYELDIHPRQDMANHWEATTVERLLETLRETIIDSVMMGMEVRIRRIKKNATKKISKNIPKPNTRTRVRGNGLEETEKPGK
jgi:hypothetical protein